MKRPALIRPTLIVVVLANLAAVGYYLVARDGGAEPTPADSASDVFSRLEARPLKLPTLGAGESCILSGFTPLPGVPGIALGPLPLDQRASNTRRVLARLRRGPVYVAIGSVPGTMHLFPTTGRSDSAATQIADSDWRGSLDVWISRPSYEGPVLVRGRRLDGPQRLGFGAGRRPSYELRLPVEGWRNELQLPGLLLGGGTLDLPDGWRTVTAWTRVRTPGCYAFQVDGEGFSYALTFSAVFQAESVTADETDRVYAAQGALAEYCLGRSLHASTGITATDARRAAMDVAEILEAKPDAWYRAPGTKSSKPLVETARKLRRELLRCNAAIAPQALQDAIAAASR